MRVGAAIGIAAAALCWAGCRCGGEPLVAVIQLHSDVPATCIRLAVTRPNGAPGGESYVPTVAGQDVYRVAVFQGQLPPIVNFQAYAFTGPDGCNYQTQPLTLISASAILSGAFDQPAPRQIPLSLGPRADALTIVPPPQGKLLLYDCTAARLEARFDGGLAGVVQNTPVTLSETPGIGLYTFLDPSCLTPVSVVTLQTGDSKLDLHLLATDGGTYELTAASVTLGGASQWLTALPSFPVAVRISGLPPQALRGACLPIALDVVNASGVPTVIPAATTIALGAPLLSAGFFSDATCTTPISSVAVNAWSSGAAAYLRPNTAGTLPVTASSPDYASDTKTLPIFPNVRAGTCRMGLGEAKVTCPIAEPVFAMSRAFAIIQAIPDGDMPVGAEARCTLSSLSTIDCARDAGIGSVDIGWQVAELATGIKVQRATLPCSNGTLQTLPQPFNPAEAFTLFTAEHLGAIIDEGDHKIVRLVGSNQVELLADTTCGTGGVNDVQVVELAGAVVDRALTGSFAATSKSISSLPIVDPLRTFLLASARFVQNTGVLCGFHVRGEITSPSGLDFTRGDGLAGAACQLPNVADLAWERVQLPAGYSVQQVLMAITDGGSSASATISRVDPTRTLVFASGQFNDGQGFGETSYNAAGTPGAAGARFSLGAPNRVDLVRGIDGGTARWTAYVVQLP